LTTAQNSAFSESRKSSEYKFTPLSQKGARGDFRNGVGGFSALQISVGAPSSLYIPSNTP
jgi:hypothetical protein